MAGLDFQAVARAALAQAHVLLPEWFPGGSQEGPEYVVTNPTRADKSPGSFKVNLNTGKWGDFATDDKGGDLISLLAYRRGYSQAEAARELAERLGLRTDTHRESSKSATRPAPEPPAWLPIMPVPSDAGKPPDSLWQNTPHNRPPDHKWPYMDQEGRLLGGVVRWDTPGQTRSKDIRPLTYCKGPDGSRAWRMQGFPDPRPLYGLDKLAAKPDAPVLVVEGEKAADAAQESFPDMMAVASPGGGNSAGKADWAPLQGRTVTIWPDADQPGQVYAGEVVRLAREAGAAEVRVVGVPRDFPQKWDLADDAPEGYGERELRDLLENAPQAAKPGQANVMESGPPPGWPFKVDDRGVFKKVKKEDTATGEHKATWVRICSRLDVLSVTRDSEGKSWGRLLAIKTRDNKVNEWAMPMELMAGDGSSYRAELLNLGLEISPGVPARNALQEYISTAIPSERARCVDRLGWHDSTFVLPDQAFGLSQGDRVLFQVGTTRDHQFLVNGTLDGWQEQIARPCVGNTRLAFALCAAFTAPLLNLVGAEGGGFHFRGGSSIGKTTALHVAGSVWGGGGINGYCRNWRATSNGLEAVGAAHCDALLCLDEMGQIEGKEAGEVAYMLSNGQGKTRARRNGSGRAPAQWRVLFLSTGELSLADKVNESGKRARAGQEVRLVDIPADAGADLGILEELHGFGGPGALADHLRLAAGQYYGVAARAFLEHITANPEGLGEIIRQARQEFIARFCPPNADAQVKRVADRFALVAAGGTLAKAIGVLPWPGDEAEHGVAACFSAWLDQRGGAGAQEEQAGLEAVRRFIQAHGESRFQPWDYTGERLLINRAGFVRPGDEGREYLVFLETFQREICNGLDAKRVARDLLRRGLLIPDGRGSPAKLVRLPGVDKPTRMYVLKGAILGSDTDD